MRFFCIIHRPLVDALSIHYECNFKTMTFAGIKNFFEVHSGDFKEKLGNGRITLINFVDFQDIKKRHIPTLKVQAFEKFAESSVPSGNLNNQNVEQHRGLWSYCSILYPLNAHRPAGPMLKNVCT
ncbi:MAG: hypothetical protein ACEY3A_04000 [Wolbachia sp.]